MKSPWLLLGLLLMLGIPDSLHPAQTPCPAALDPVVFAELSVPQQAFLADVLGHPGPPRAFCWSGSPDPSVLEALAGVQGAAESLYEYNDGNHWGRTATDGSGLSRGDPITLTWGILPDGVMDSGANPAVPSSLINRFDNQFGAGPGGSDLTQRPWFRFFAESFARWGEVIGVRYVYHPADDEAAFPNAAGVLGVRPDVRIAARSIDGNQGNNIFGFNYFPDLGDMVLDTDNMGFMGSSSKDFVALRNLIAHEHGHGLGISHSCPEIKTKLMEPTLTTQIDGPQHDDLLSGHRGYGDRLEFPNRNDGPGTATLLGALAPGDTVRVTGLSIESEFDEDWFAITLAARMRVTARMIPMGEEYVAGPQVGGSCTAGQPFNSLRSSNLGITLFNRTATATLGSSVGLPIGTEETIIEALVTDGAGTYYVKILPEADDDDPQFYDLEIIVTAGNPPVALCRNLNVCNGQISATRFNQGSFDPDDDPFTIRVEPPGPYPPGETPVLFIVDDEVFADTCSATITVNAPPVAVFQNVVVDADTSDGCSANVSPDAFDAGSSDPEGGEVFLEVIPAGPYPLGETAVQCVVTDGCGASDTSEVTVTVNCLTPVRLGAFTAQRQGTRAVVSWQVHDATDHAGFHVHREVDEGTRERRTLELLSGDDHYRWVDPQVPDLPVRYWLEERSRSGHSTWHGPVALSAEAISALVLSPGEPNPFAAQTTWSLTLPQAGMLRVTLFDARGRQVRVLRDDTASAGRHLVTWDGRTDLGQRTPAGLYFVRVESQGGSRVGKVVLLP